MSKCLLLFCTNLSLICVYSSFLLTIFVFSYFINNLFSLPFINFAIFENYNNFSYLTPLSFRIQCSYHLFNDSAFIYFIWYYYNYFFIFLGVCSTFPSFEKAFVQNSCKYFKLNKISIKDLLTSSSYSKRHLHFGKTSYFF